MIRNFYVSSRPVGVGGDNHRPGSRRVTTQYIHDPANLIRLADYSSQGQPDLAAASQRGPFLQALIDIAAVGAAAVLVCATATAIGASFFILLFVNL